MERLKKLEVLVDVTNKRLLVDNIADERYLLTKEGAEFHIYTIEHVSGVSKLVELALDDAYRSGSRRRG